MNLSMSEAQSLHADSISITLLLTRNNHCGHDGDGFASEVEFLLLREGPAWVVREHRLLWIT
jgi:hypothetical protein